MIIVSNNGCLYFVERCRTQTLKEAYLISRIIAFAEDRLFPEMYNVNFYKKKVNLKQMNNFK